MARTFPATNFTYVSSSSWAATVIDLGKGSLPTLGRKLANVH
ncbi:MAG: hypothetical protein R3E68_08975 [Burkholderiaceae bacterium]